MSAAWPALLIGLAAFAPAARAQVSASPPSAASVTIYRDRTVDAASLAELWPSQGLALISETRTLDVPAAGRVRIAFKGVADTMVPQTAALEGLPGATTIERNEDYDLLSPGTLILHSDGRPVRVVETLPGKGGERSREAVLRASPGNVLLDFGGRIEALGCGGPPTRLVFDRAPPELSDKPTFSVLAEVPKAGRYTVRLSYLATGFSWAADYVAHIDPDGRTLDLEGWLTLANKSSAGFARAPTDVVAGDLERDRDATRPPDVEGAPGLVHSVCWGQRLAAPPPAPPAPLVERGIGERRFSEVQEMVVTASKRRQAIQGELGDYKLYTLPEPTEVAARQTKQVAFLDLHAAPFTRVYVWRFDEYAGADGQGLAPDVVLRLSNTAAAGLGKPLPAGTVSVMAQSPAGPVLVGEQKIADTAVGLPLELTLGRALDVPVAQRVVAETRKADRVTTSVAVSFENDKPEPIVVEHRQPRPGDDFSIVAESHPSTFDRGERVWTFRLAPGQRAQLTYTMTSRL